jgi:Animal haem peroxidase
MKTHIVSRIWADLAGLIDRRFGWHTFGTVFGIALLVGIRTQLRARNLFDTGLKPPREAWDPRWEKARSPDGSWNDLQQPGMGARGARFGRNVPPELTDRQTLPAMLQPSPRLISTRLLTREHLIVFPGANSLVAAWLQFEVHDWFSHGKNLTNDPWRLPVPAKDIWEPDPMQIRRTPLDPDYDSSSGGPPTYVTDDTHWWDGSQIYGSDLQSVEARRGPDGTLRLDEDQLIPEELEKHLDLAGPAGNAWLGLAALHVLFTREHNAIVEMLHKRRPGLTEDQTFDTARLINAALMAKIHTVEWTPAVISHPTTQRAMKINWWGMVGERATRRFGRLSANELISGIPGSPTDHDGVPYSLTEEFTAVYRMHPLLLDRYTFRSAADDSFIDSAGLTDLDVLHTRQRLRQFGMTNTLYSLGREAAGLVCLHNYPRSLQRMTRPDGEVIDLAAIDVLRNRERGVPRYNEFRRLLQMKTPRTFDELTPYPVWANELREAYDGDIESVDLLVGSYAEPLPKGFAFSDTAFRIFILMASRRLRSDRFFTDSYEPKTYTEEGLDWVADNTLSSVLVRHFPELSPALKGIGNAFGTWNRVVC